MLYVVDAGVAVKWFIEEDDSPTARQLMNRYNQRRDDLIAPDLIIAEVANALWKRSQRGDIRVDYAADSLADFLSLEIPLVSSASIAIRAFTLAGDYNLVIYDALYLALALDRNCDLITADVRFFNATSATFPHIRLLSQWRPSLR